MGVLTVRRFDWDAGAQLRKAVEAMTAAAGTPPRGVVIDLRDNEGGLFDAAIGAADLLLDAGEIGVEHGRGPDVERHMAQDGDVLRGTALRVLINSRTAAGAEIFAGALQRSVRARLLGGRTYGRGTVQTLLVVGDAGALRLTTSEFRLAGDQPLDKVGLTPDRLVQPTSGAPDAVLDAAVAELSG